MGKIIFRFWLVNVLISVALFILYRLVIAEPDTAATGFLETIIVILDIIVNLGFSTIYLFAVILCSLLFFLNHIEKIRRNKGLSFLTFSGIPAVCLILLIIYILVEFYRYHMVLDPLKMLLLFSVIYLASTILEFILFRKIIEKQQADPKVQQ